MAKKQHELLAYQTDIHNACLKITRETLALFDKSTSFDEMTKTYQAFTEGDKDIPEKESKLMTTTVMDRLEYTNKFIANAINVISTQEKTNTVAKADITIKDDDGNKIATIAKDVPVSALLQLEKKFVDFRAVFDKIPTFNTETHWVKGINASGVECYQISEPVKTVRTRTEIITESFNPNPDQNSDKFKLEPREKKVTTPVGEYTTMNKTGRISPRDKANMLERLDQVIKAIKSARSEANNTDIIEMNFGRDMMKYILNG